MKAIFMTEVGGNLMEVERREVKPTPVYYCARRESLQEVALGINEIPRALEVKKERWVAHSIPNHSEGFAVFLFEGYE